MRGIPKAIKTRADLQNLLALAQENKAGVERAALAQRVRELFAKQYHKVPILSVSGKIVTTNYFPEALKNGTTEDGLTITKVEHIEDTEAEGESTQYAETRITLSAVPDNTDTLSVYMEDNYITQNGFDLAEMNFILGVLENA